MPAKMYHYSLKKRTGSKLTGYYQQNVTERLLSFYINSEMIKKVIEIKKGFKEKFKSLE
jgi:hypothetical protein